MKNTYNPQSTTPPSDFIKELIQEKGYELSYVCSKLNISLQECNELLDNELKINEDIANGLEAISAVPSYFWMGIQEL